MHDMGIGVDLRIRDRQGADARVGDELGLRYHAEPDPLGHGLANRFAAADLHHHPRLDAGLAHRLVESAARRRAGFAHDQALAGHLAHPQPTAPGEGMVGRAHHDDAVPAIGNRHQPRIGIDMGQHRHVGAVVEQVGHGLA